MRETMVTENGLPSYTFIVSLGVAVNFAIAKLARICARPGITPNAGVRITDKISPS
ncbi:hypothetical protein BDR03DRAFT_939592 [Suillus americanus]|nr:hypothetical protein BDR03DRAFT_939592 [Suillus americanus]